MAHIIVLMRGIITDMNRLINDLQAQYSPYKYGTQELALQWSVRPMQLYEIVVPESEMQVCMNTLWQSPDVDIEKATPYKAQRAVLRKALGAKKFPLMDKTKGKRLLFNQNIAIYPIGYRPDKIDPKDNHETI